MRDICTDGGGEKNIGTFDEVFLEETRSRGGRPKLEAVMQVYWYPTSQFAQSSRPPCGERSRRTR